MKHYSPGIRTKLITIFILIKVLPLIALAWFAWTIIDDLTNQVNQRSTRIISNTHEVVDGVSELSKQNSIRALDLKSRETIERLTTDTARNVAAFLYDRDRDIQLASALPTDKLQYSKFLSSRTRPVTLHSPWVMDSKGEKWVPRTTKEESIPSPIRAQNEDNRKNFHYRSPDHRGIVQEKPLYLEMTFIDLTGKEIIKVTNSKLLSPVLRNVSDPRNTYCGAETYFESLKELQAGEIYVSEVIGPYVNAHLIGTYNKVKAQQKGIDFAPEQSGYAGKENPVGKRFQGIVRWGTPVLKNDQVIGYVTLALDHTHIMEFTDHIVPTTERFSPISDAGSGNYAFMWDYKGRNISHPRDYFIVGYDPETGEQVVPWLDEEMYTVWQQSNMSMNIFQSQAPQFKEQTLAKKPALELTRSGMLGLDCRYLNFAPQCTDWFTLTQEGGSGSFVIFWSGLWKLTTAAVIPYYTGMYNQTPRGFGFVTIGANVDEFHRSAVDTAATIHSIQDDFTEQLKEEQAENKRLIHSFLQDALNSLSFYTALMVLVVILIAIFIAGALTSRITTIIDGIRRFQQGDRTFRLKQLSGDEMGQLSKAYNEMADTVQAFIGSVESSKKKVENINSQLEKEIVQRREIQEELSVHRDNLEILVNDRTKELEKEILERSRIEKIQLAAEERLRKQNNAILNLAGDKALYEGDLDSSLNKIVPLAAQTLQSGRCGVWLLNEEADHFVCQKLIVGGEQLDPRNKSLPVNDFPHFAATLQTNKPIVAADISNDERIADLANQYFPSRSIQSIIVTSINVDGRSAGYISFAHLHTTRDWHLDEVNFATSIADIIGLTIGTANRRLAMEEKKQLTTRLRRAEKMEAIGTLAGGVAHDLNNILSGIASYPEYLLLQLPEKSPLREPLKTIADSGHRAATIVQDLLTLARRGVATTEVVDINMIVKEYLKSPEHTQLVHKNPHISIETSLDPKLLNILGSPVHLSKTLANLVLNAIEAMPEAGLLSLSTENCYIDRPIKGYDVVNEGDYVALTVKDTGTGILPEDVQHIFEPFYTNKTMGRSGTGLGMAVVWGTVKDHLGYIDFDTREGEGSRFTLYFPVTRKEAKGAQPKNVKDYRGDGETILVVDDIKEQREIASAILSALNYRVSTVSSGEEAINFLHDHNVDLLVLDMIMDPGIDGLDTYREVIKHHPGQKAIIASGFSETSRIREVLRLGASVYLKKPYTVEKIGMAIQSVLHHK